MTGQPLKLCMTIVGLRCYQWVPVLNRETHFMEFKCGQPNEFWGHDDIFRVSGRCE